MSRGGVFQKGSVRGRGARISYCPGEELSGIVSSIGVYNVQGKGVEDDGCPGEG